MVVFDRIDISSTSSRGSPKGPERSHDLYIFWYYTDTLASVELGRIRPFKLGIRHFLLLKGWIVLCGCTLENGACYGRGCSNWK